MEDGTADDYALVDSHDSESQGQLPARLTALLEPIAQEKSPFQISRLDHSLQCATRARAAGADDDWQFAALLHDIGDTVAPDNHSCFAASVIAPYVRPEVEWVVRMHGVFQGYYYRHHLGLDRHAREQYRDANYFEHAVAFCHLYDQCSFDPDYPTANLDSFGDLLTRVCARKPFEQGAPQGLKAMGIGDAERRAYARVLDDSGASADS
jgi:predicted HD phosphohydrolase